MAFFEMHIFSKALGMQTTVNVLIPQRSTDGEIGVVNNAGEKEYKCLYLLHGLSDDHSIWLRRTSIERYASKYGICVVMPCAGKSFYTDMKYGEGYYTYISQELPSLMREYFRVSSRREDNAVAGLSMGGYGALKIALRNSDSFSAAAGLSSVADIANSEGWIKDCLIPVFGDEVIVPPDEDLFALAEKTSYKANKPRLYMAVGRGDGFCEANRRLSEKLDSLGYELKYDEAEGGHDWEFWDEYIQKAMEWIFG